MNEAGPILRLFEVRCRPGCRDKLMENSKTTSADVVRNRPGNRGYFFGYCVQGGEDTVMLVSIWRDLDAVKTRFGEDWQKSYLPYGYEDLIDECSIRHFDTGSGWHVDVASRDDWFRARSGPPFTGAFHPGPPVPSNNALSRRSWRAR